MSLCKMNACTEAWSHVSNRWETPILRMSEVRNEVGMYAKNEEARRLIFAKQKVEALDFLGHLPESKGFFA